MASTSWRSTGATLYAGGYTFGLNSRTDYTSLSRTNNTVKMNARVSVRVTGGGSYFSGVNIYGAFSLPQGTTRESKTKVSTGGNVGSTYSTSYRSLTFTVSANATSTTTNNGGAYGGDGVSWAGGQTISIPAAGSPSLGTPTFSNVTSSSVKITGKVNSWGANCTAGAGVRFGVWWTGQDQKYNSRTTSSSPTWTVTGIPSNMQVSADMDATNGAGKSTDGANGSTVTLPLAPKLGATTFEATTATVATTQNVGGGHYTITKQYRYQQVDGAWSAWTTYTGDDIVLTDLLPSTDYNIQVRSTTTAGTTTGAITPLGGTLPAGKLVMPNGDVINAVPHAVFPDGEVKMLQVKRISNGE